MTGPLKSKQEAADFLGIPVSTLTKLVTKRKVPFTRIGETRGIKFSDENLAEIVAAGRVAPMSAAPQVTAPVRRTRKTSAA